MMDKTTLRKVKVVPKKHRFVGDILPNNGRITEETEKNLNQKEIIRAMQFADCFEGTTLLTPQNYLDDPTEELIEDPEDTKEDPSTPKPGGSGTGHTDKSQPEENKGQSKDQSSESEQGQQTDPSTQSVNSKKYVK